MNLENSRILAQLYIQACQAELEAIKPGNVSVYSSGHGMQAEDFIESAQVSAEPLARAESSLGERIYAAVKSTRNAVGCNTNLGIILLCAPVMHALLTQGRPVRRSVLIEVLNSTTVEDAELVYQAIRLAAPGGLGESEQHDVRKSPTVNLLTAMQAAAKRDRIAYQYCNGFTDIFADGVPTLLKYRAKWGSEKWAATEVYLRLLRRIPDSLIARKYGDSRAEEISVIIARLEDGLGQAESPADYAQRLLDLDAEFKRTGINPGTTADLTVTSLFVARLMEFFGTDIKEVSAFFTNQGEKFAGTVPTMYS